MCNSCYESCLKEKIFDCWDFFVTFRNIVLKSDKKENF